MAANLCYRLLRHAGARRILFLVDRANLGRQAVREFEGFTVPDDPRKFTELYNVRRLASSQLDMADEAATKVHVSTIQRLYSILRGDDDYDEGLDEASGFETGARPAGGGGLQPEGAGRVLRRDHRRRVPPLDLRGVAAGAGVLRRVPGGADGHAGHPDVRVLRPEPGDGVPPRAGGGRPGERGLRRVPHPHRDHRDGRHGPRGVRDGVPRPRDPPAALGEGGRPTSTTTRRSWTAAWSPRIRYAPWCAPCATRCR